MSSLSLLPLNEAHEESSFSDGSSSENCADDRPKASLKKKANKTLKRVNKNTTVTVTHTVESILATWNETTDYGKSFRAMVEEDQTKEVLLLNRGAAKGMKGLIKTKMLASNYKIVVEEKLRAHIEQSRMVPAAMFHSAPKISSLMTTNPSFISVGEWVEVDADRSPGFNSEGGIAVIISVQDNFADVKYVFIARCS